MIFDALLCRWRLELRIAYIWSLNIAKASMFMIHARLLIKHAMFFTKKRKRKKHAMLAYNLFAT